MASDKIVPEPDRANHGILSNHEHLLNNMGVRTVKGGALSIGSQMAGMVLQLGTMIILARLLVPSDFGLIALAGVVTGFLAMFTELGLATATIQRKTINQDLVSALFYINIMMGCVIALLLAALAPFASILFGEPRLTHVIWALALTIPVISSSSQHSALLQRNMRWIPIYGITVFVQVISCMTAVVGAWVFGLGYWAIIAQSWVSALLTTALSWNFSKWRPSRVSDWRSVREPLQFGLHLTLFSFLNYFHRQFDDGLIGWRWGTNQLGHYNRAYTLLLLPLRLLNQPVSNAVIPALSRLQDKPDRWRNTYLDAVAPITVVSAFLGANLMVLSGPLLHILYGPAWDRAGTILGYLAISMIPAGAMNTAGWIYISLGNTKQMSHWALITTPFWVVAFLIALPYGAEGVAIGYSLAVLVLVAPCLAFASRNAPISLADILAVVIPPIFTGLLSGVAAKLAIEQGEFSGHWPVLMAGVLATSGIFSLILGLYCLANRHYRWRLVHRLSHHRKSFFSQGT
ncbi:lipopolysaccharide biosynthesis protein [Altererythrobacter aquiaggeris]|uniref:lipopolysaccharide biosynthesis protein n=1 Tax=Aestuarierythrobacter aquiaggeris TaxID=1898396 RepID=UPI0030161650